MSNAPRTPRTDADLVAEFLATRGVTRVEEGARAIARGEFRRVARDGGKARTYAQIDDEATHASERAFHEEYERVAERQILGIKD
jgi:hypothetical protein